VNRELYKYITNGGYGKKVDEKDIVLVSLEPKEEFHLHSYGGNVHLYKMQCKRCEGGYMSIVFQHRPEYIYRSEYNKHKSNFTEVLDKDLIY
ncbi:MAG: hypothetical protein NT085_02590, partial [candidate division SR1 bacterium]|nr:hypothetical protein [candidate division SR1 bacterium]